MDTDAISKKAAEQQIRAEIASWIWSASDVALDVIEAVLEADLSEIKVEGLIEDLKMSKTVPKPLACPECGSDTFEVWQGAAWQFHCLSCDLLWNLEGD